MAHLSHLAPSEKAHPLMVDISAKQATVRSARAEARLLLPAEAMTILRANEFATKKGSVLHTAVLAGIMGTKQTSTLIPLCHALNLTACSIDIHDEEHEFIIHCTVQTLAQTGVEMEALTGASIAALTLYDMCKSLIKDDPLSMQIQAIRLLEKTK